MILLKSIVNLYVQPTMFQLFQDTVEINVLFLQFSRFLSYPILLYYIKPLDSVRSRANRRQSAISTQSRVALRLLLFEMLKQDDCSNQCLIAAASRPLETVARIVLEPFPCSSNKAAGFPSIYHAQYRRLYDLVRRNGTGEDTTLIRPLKI